MRPESLGEGGEDLFPGAGQGADGPIGTEEEPVKAEEFENVLDVGGELFGLPVLVVGFGDHAGDFAVEGLVFGEAFHVPGPGLEEAFLDVGFGDVVDDHGEVGDGVDDLGEVGKVGWFDEEVVGDFAALEFLEAGEDGGLDDPLDVGFVVDDVADAGELGVFLELVEGFAEVGVLQIRPGDDAENGLVLGGEVEHPGGFFRGVGGLDEDSAIELVIAQGRLEIGGKEGSPQRMGRGRHPKVVDEIGIPVVLVGVDAHRE